MALSESELAFIQDNKTAAMITTAADGTPKVARVGVGIVDGKIWSSSTADRVRTKRLRRDPHCVLYVHDAGRSWLTIESVVTILDGPDAPELNLRLIRTVQGRPSGPLAWITGELDDAAFLKMMIDEHRLVYEFEPQRVYGIH